MLKHVLSVLAYVFATFAVQASSHFLINVDHYKSLSNQRPEPLFVLGFLSMFIQGSVLTWLYGKLPRQGNPLGQGIAFALPVGAMLGSYIVFAEPAKIVIPSLAQWIRVEAGAWFVQYALFGALLGLIHDRLGRR